MSDDPHDILDPWVEIERLRAENANLKWQLDFLRSQLERVVGDEEGES